MEMNYNMVAHNSALKAAAAIYLCSKILKSDGNEIFNQLSKDFCLPVDQIRNCSMDLFLNLCNQQSEKMTAIKRKFSHDSYSNVASLKISLKGNF